MQKHCCGHTYRSKLEATRKQGRCPLTSSLPTLLYHSLLAESHSDPAGKAGSGFVAQQDKVTQRRVGSKLRDNNLITGTWGSMTSHRLCTPQCLEEVWLEGSIGKRLDLESVDPDLPVNFSVIYWSRQITLNLYFLIGKMGK